MGSTSVNEKCLFKIYQKKKRRITDVGLYLAKNLQKMSKKKQKKGLKPQNFKGLKSFDEAKFQ